MTMTLVDPAGAGGGAERAAAPRLDGLSGLRVGLLSNGKANAELLLRETAALFESEHGCHVAGFVDKRNAGRPALPEHFDALARDADFLITAVGD